MTEEQIIDICKQRNITNYIINSDMSVDVNGNVDLANDDLTDLPLKFNKVTGSFYCSGNKLTSLKGCPLYTGGDFDCTDNPKLTSLKDLPINFYVGGEFCCHKNSIKNPAEYSRLLFGIIGGKIYTG